MAEGCSINEIYKHFNIATHMKVIVFLVMYFDCTYGQRNPAMHVNAGVADEEIGCVRCLRADVIDCNVLRSHGSATLESETLVGMV